MFMKKRICVKTKKLSTSPIIKDLFDKTNIICVTGQMASGKNFVCSELEKMDWTSVDADCLVHKAIDNSTEEIVQTFLPYTTQAKLQILTNDNKIDRKALGKLLFENPHLLKKQEELEIKNKSIENCIAQINDFLNNHERGSEFYLTVELDIKKKELEILQQEYAELNDEYLRLKEENCYNFSEQEELQL